MLCCAGIRSVLCRCQESCCVVQLLEVCCAGVRSVLCYAGIRSVLCRCQKCVVQASEVCCVVQASEVRCAGVRNVLCCAGFRSVLCYAGVRSGGHRQDASVCPWLVLRPPSPATRPLCGAPSTSQLLHSCRSTSHVTWLKFTTSDDVSSYQFTVECQ